MSNLYKKLERGIQCLPPKDAQLSADYLKKRDFNRLREIVESCYTMKLMDDNKEVHTEKWVNVDEQKLFELRFNLMEYMSYLDVPDNSDELYEDCI